MTAKSEAAYARKLKQRERERRRADGFVYRGLWTKLDPAQWHYVRELVAALEALGYERSDHLALLELIEKRRRAK